MNQSSRDLISIIIFIIYIFTLRQGAKVLYFLHNIVYYGPYFMGKEVGGWVTTFVVQCTFVHIIVVLYRPFGIWRVLMKRWLRSSATSSWMEMCFLITSALSLSASREGWGHVSHDRCHVSLVPCHSVTAAECGHGHD